MEPLSRQYHRQMERAFAAQQLSQEKRDARTAATRSLKQRQKRREFEGFYDDRGSTFARMTGSLKTLIEKRKIRKGKLEGRFIRQAMFDGKLFNLHATKGWRVA